MGSGSGTGSTGGVFHRSLLIHFINRVSAFSAALSEALAQSRWRGWDPIGALRCVRNRRALCGDVSMETAGSVVMGRERGGLYPELLMHGYTRRLFLQHVPWSHLKGTYQEKSNFPWSFQIQGFCALTVDITFKIPVHPETYTLKTVWLFELMLRNEGKSIVGGCTVTGHFETKWEYSKSWSQTETVIGQLTPISESVDTKVCDVWDQWFLNSVSS